jgi:hypothetical protein
VMSRRSKSAIVGVSVWLLLSTVSILVGDTSQGKAVFISAVVLTVSYVLGVVVGKVVTEIRQRRGQK